MKQDFYAKLNPGMPLQKLRSTRRGLVFTSKLDLNLMKKREIIRNITLYDAETWTVRKVAEKFLESSEVWCWGKMERITLTDHVKNEEVLHKVKELGISYLQ